MLSRSFARLFIAIVATTTLLLVVVVVIIIAAAAAAAAAITDEAIQNHHGYSLACASLASFVRSFVEEGKAAAVRQADDRC